MAPDPIVIACSTDERYAPGLAVMILSLLDHYRGQKPVELYVLETDLSEKTKHRLLSSWNDPRLHVSFLRPDATRIAGLTCFLGVHQAMYYYLTLPEMLPQYPKVLKMDADMLVVDDIEILWNTNLGSHPMAATRVLRSPYVSSEWALPNYKELGIAPTELYCNAGLQLMDLDVWRAEEIAQKIIDHTRKYESIVRYWDQDGVNAVLAGRWLELDPAWNADSEGIILTGWVPEDPAFVQEVSMRAKIIHFVVHKPWNKDCKHPRTPLFLCYLQKTAWKGLARSLLWNRRLRSMREFLLKTAQ